MSGPAGWGRRGVVGLGLALILILMLAHIWIRLRVVSVGYALSDTGQLASALKAEQAALRVEWQAATTPSHLSRLAGERLALSFSRPEQVVILSEE